MLKFFVSTLALVAAATASVAAKPTKNVIELAMSIPELSSFVAVLKSTNITSLLEATGPFTIFAPTNAALAGRSRLYSPKLLQAVLRYHVIAGKTLYSKDLKANQAVATLEGKTVDITKLGGQVILNPTWDGGYWEHAVVISADNAATNGVVHIIDTMIHPITTVDPIGVIAYTLPDFSTMDTLLGAAGLGQMLRSSSGPFTVFGPSNDAFLALGKATLRHLFDPANVKELQTILNFHIIKGAAVYDYDLKGSSVTSFDTLDKGQFLEVTKSATGALVINANAALVINANNPATNGVVHIIDTVLVPPTSVFAGLTAKAAPIGGGGPDWPSTMYCGQGVAPNGGCASMCGYQWISIIGECTGPAPGQGHSSYCYSLDKSTVHQGCSIHCEFAWNVTQSKCVFVGKPN